HGRMSTETQDPVDAVTWDLAPLVDDGGDEAVDRLLDDAERRAREFKERYAGKVAELDAGRLREAMTTLATLYELVGRAGSYAMLRFSAAVDDPATGALLQKVQERGAAIETELLFFDLEWQALPEDRAYELLNAPGLDFAAHHLRVSRRLGPYRLSEPEERVMTELRVTGRSAWARLFEEQVSAIAVAIDGEQVPLENAQAKLFVPARDERRGAAEAITEALRPGLRTRSYVFNTLLGEKATDDRLRGFPHWLAERNIENEVSDESVQALVDAVRARYEIARRWYRLKARLIGVDKLTDYDRNASIATDDERIDWAQARDLVLDTYRSFSPELGDLTQRFFDERWIDAPSRPGKRGGAFSASTVPSVHPYVMLNFTGTRRDVLVMAHELGHGVHQALAAEQGIFHQNTPLTVAETASVFGEALTFGRLLEQTQEPRSRLALLAENIEGSIATVFRQISMHTFEDAVHGERRTRGELPPDRFNELWAGSQEELFGDSMEVTDGYRLWWSYVHHFIGSPGYVYAYAYGQLLALSVYRRYLDEGEPFVAKYLDLLRAGGSQPPEELGRIVGVDLTDPGFWNSGLDLVEEQLTEAEAAARAIVD
ncbi:MAG: oligoendopeptidase, partial [Thermoleophilales bacterium]|nr:oligoendopeptidase [Thermoleophilales bacterium]